MQILAVDIGTGTQDILLYDTALQPENSFKIVAPSPTMIVARQVKAATQRRQPLIIDGHTMGGGPSHWAVRDHTAAGGQVFMTPAAARSFDDDLARMRAEMQIELVSADEVKSLERAHPDWLRLTFHDFDYRAIADAFASFGLALAPDGVAAAVFDHGEAPPGFSDRQFRFDYLNERLRAKNHLSTFAFAAGDIPPIMTRMRSAAASATATGMPDVPLLVMDTAPAAVYGGLLDPALAACAALLVANVGNFHTLAFRLGPGGIEGLFEHHTGMLDPAKLDTLLRGLAGATLRHEDVFNDHGHGALLLASSPAAVDLVAVTGPRRSLLTESTHRVHFAAPFGDMMLAGCFGLLRAWSDIFPGSAAVAESLQRRTTTAPWELL